MLSSGDHVVHVVLCVCVNSYLQPIARQLYPKINDAVVNPIMVRGHGRGKDVKGSHHGGNPLLKPTGIQIATKFFPGPTP